MAKFAYAVGDQFTIDNSDSDEMEDDNGLEMYEVIANLGDGRITVKRLHPDYVGLTETLRIDQVETCEIVAYESRNQGGV